VRPGLQAVIRFLLWGPGGISAEGLGQWVINSVAVYSCEVGAVLRTVLFWVITQRVVVISYRRFRTIIGQIGSSETMVRNYHYLLRNDPEERSSLLLRGGSLKSCVGAVLPTLNKNNQVFYFKTLGFLKVLSLYYY
jgi:hypothetical protein